MSTPVSADSFQVLCTIRVHTDISLPLFDSYGVGPALHFSRVHFVLYSWTRFLPVSTGDFSFCHHIACTVTGLKSE